MPSLVFEACRLLFRYYKFVFTKVTILLLILGSALPVGAEQLIERETVNSSWGLGLGVYSEQKAYIDVERKNLGVPVLTFENQYIRLAGPELRLRLPSYEISNFNRLDFSLIGRVGINNYDESDTWILEGMEDRKGGFWAGAGVKWKSRLANISAEFLSEVAGDSEGLRFNLGIEKTWHFAKKYTFSPRVEIEWHDDNYVDYYYGVQANEVNADRALYKGEAAINMEVGARVGYMFSQNKLLILDFSVTSLAKEIKNSPLIGRSAENNVFFGYIYKF
ncbi:MipA/OmpV family protein [Idiomarina sp. M1R2S28]|uniref:MipA/OmpV family protein n=1 Tax=Idiomarina rhizosphaerae TaxID=2961572 RepID=A0A9X2FUP1_9GAMM|nr:MipA/OmpV family protein [Idiomarina rhizosphaerae]MCP1339592.1 MipA/OmpV family protein [Idiomarina rhizosphaerae]